MTTDFLNFEWWVEDDGTLTDSPSCAAGNGGTMTTEREPGSLVGRAVEAAARDQSDRRTMTPWGETSQWWRERHRAEIEAAVKAALGVVADHCTTTADRYGRQIEALNLDPDHKVVVAAHGRCAGYEGLAAELRETPDG